MNESEKGRVNHLTWLLYVLTWIYLFSKPASHRSFVRNESNCVLAIIGAVPPKAALSFVFFCVLNARNQNKGALSSAPVCPQWELQLFNWHPPLWINYKASDPPAKKRRYFCISTWENCAIFCISLSFYILCSSLATTPYDRVYYACSSLFTLHIVTLFSVRLARLDIEYLNVDWMIYDNDNGATEQK